MSDNLLARVTKELSQAKRTMLGVAGAVLALVGYKLRFDIAAVLIWFTPGLRNGVRMNSLYYVFGRMDLARIGAGQSATRCMNLGFGYSEPDFDDANIKKMVASVPAEWTKYESYCIQMYDHITRQVDLSGKAVAEVGCGRGGCALYLASSKKPVRYTGVDYSPLNIKLAKARCLMGSALEFVVGDAGALPLKDASYDVVLNVESSHCYPDLVAFFSEVRRILRPDGVFIYADLYTPDKVPAIKEKLAAVGFETTHEEDITPNIALAIRRYGPSMAETIQNAGYTIGMRYFLNQWMGDYEGNAGYFESRTTVYFALVLRPIPKAP